MDHSQQPGTSNNGQPNTPPEAEARSIPDFNPYEVEPAWRDYPCEWKRPRFAHIPEVDWVKLYHLRQHQRRQAQGRSAGDNGAAGHTPAPHANGNHAGADALTAVTSNPEITPGALSMPGTGDK
ncbi:MAG: hypothetical protein ABSG79_03815 [Bryobacteraceae bacterium]|jgi:hypothetical protein